MKRFFWGIRLAEQLLSDFLATYGIKLSAREAVFALAVVLTLVCAVATVISGGTITGSNILLGKKYGKYSHGKAGVKRIFFVIAIVFAVLTFLVFLIDGLANFTNTAMFFSYIKSVFLCIVIEVVALVVGAVIGEKRKQKRDKRYENEINTILSENPVFVETLNLLKNNSNIKMVEFFRDGIAFYNNVNLPEDNGKQEVSYSDESFPENGKEKGLATIGSVAHALSDFKIKFSDFKYRDSESAMQDLYKYIFKATSPRFERIEYKKEWVYHKIGDYSGPSGAIINDNMVTFTGSHSEPDKIESSGIILISCILYENSLSDSQDDSLKEW